MKDAAPLEKANWIRVADRAPEDCSEVLMYFEAGMTQIGFYEAESPGEFDTHWQVVVGDGSEWIDYPPSHWMPLPDSPDA